MKVKLTKEEFIRRSMNGEVFELDGFFYSYDSSERNPFRIDDMVLDGYWDDFNGINEFTVVEPKQKTKIVKEWMYSEKNKYWCISNMLMTNKEAESFYSKYTDYIYKPTGRELEVPDK